MLGADSGEAHSLLPSGSLLTFLIPLFVGNSFIERAGWLLVARDPMQPARLECVCVTAEVICVSN